MTTARARKLSSFDSQPVSAKPLQLSRQEDSQDIKVPVTRTGQPVYAQLYSWFLINDYVGKMSHEALKIYLVIISHQDSDHVAFPGHRKLAKMAVIGNDKVGPAIKELLDLGLIEILSKGAGKRSTRYGITQIPQGATTFRPEFGTENSGKSEPTTDVEQVVEDSASAPDVQSSAPGTFEGQESVSVVNKGSNEISPPKSPGTDLISLRDRTNNAVSNQQLEGKADRVRRHVQQVNPRLNQRLKSDDLRELCSTYEGNDIATVIARYGEKAESIGLIRHYLAEFPTIVEREATRQAEQRRREERLQKRAEEQAQACSSEQVRQHVKQLRAALRGNGSDSSSLEQPESESKKVLPTSPKVR